MNGDKEALEKVYQKPGVIWTREEPPKELVNLIKNGKIKPCKVIDIGCGEGFNSIFLSSRGFDVTGIDLSERAIKYAKENARNKKVSARFIAMDVNDLGKLKEKFDFVLEWALMHHIAPQIRQRYVKDLSRLLNNGGKYLSFCFNEQSYRFGRPGERERKSGENAPGLNLYFSSDNELKELFEQYFKIIEAKLITTIDKLGRKHIGNYFFMENIYVHKILHV